MNTEDLSYLCRTIGDLAGIPVRLYHGRTLTENYAMGELPADPVRLCEDALFRIREHVGYYMTEELSFYCVLNSGDVRIIVGPTGQIPSSDQELRLLAFRTGVPADETDRFVRAMKSIIAMPLESVLKILCTVNFILNGEKLTLRDLTIRDEDQFRLKKNTERERVQKRDSARAVPHNTLALEDRLLRIIRKGDTAALHTFMQQAPAIRGGQLAATQLRQRKNTFIVSTTLASRAAIQGGMDPDDALSLSDRFIQSCEMLRTPDEITNLQFHMITEYTERVERIQRGGSPTDLTGKVANYVQKHLSEPITVENIARELYISRPVLSRKFSEESGKTLTDYILEEKTEEAKHLLRYTDNSIASVSEYLGFSSQSHFTRVFRKYTGLTPQVYRTNEKPSSVV